MLYHAWHGSDYNVRPFLVMNFLPPVELNDLFVRKKSTPTYRYSAIIGYIVKRNPRVNGDQLKAHIVDPASDKPVSQSHGDVPGYFVVELVNDLFVC